MVRMGEEIPGRAQSFLASAVDASDELAEQLKSTFRVDVDPEDMSQVTGKLAKQVMHETFKAANGAKFERELDEKYGILKDFILHPTVQWIVGCITHLWRNFRFFGRPPLGTTAGVIVGLMIYRRKVGFVNMALAAAVLSGLNPVVVVAGMLAWRLWISTKHLPKSCGKIRTEYDPPEDVGPDKLSDDFTAEKVDLSASGTPDSGHGGQSLYDHVVVGSDLGGLFCAALLSRCGRRVLVLEQGPLVGAGAVVKGPPWSPREGDTGGEGGDAAAWEFETGIQCLGGGEKLMRFMQRLTLASLPGTEALEWEQLGRLESELRAYDMVSIGNGKQQMVFPAGQDKLVESLTAQFPEKRKFFQAFASQADSSIQSGLAYCIGKVFPARPSRWLDRVLKAMLVDSAVQSYSTIALRSMKDMLRAMVAAQPDGNGDDGAQAALCALFRRENLAPDRVSCAALMAQTCNTWGGLFHPKGGFRAIAERLVDSIHASGGRVLTCAKVTSVLVEGGAATGVTIVPHAAKTSNSATAATTGSSSSGNAAAPLTLRVSKGGSVISSIGIIATFHQLVPLPPSSSPAGPSTDGVKVKVEGDRAPVAAAAKGGSEGWSIEPAGYRNLRAARPRVHLCVGLQGNWVEDLEATGAYFHHVRDSSIDGGGTHGDRQLNGDGHHGHVGGGERDWYRISFMESMDSDKWRKSTTSCVVTAEMPDDMVHTIIDGVGTTTVPIGPLYYKVQTGKSARDRTRERLLRRLHKEFPFTEGRDEFVMLAEEPRTGLSHGPERYSAEGLRAPTNLKGLFLCGEDLTLGAGLEGSIQGGWIAAHAVLGYDPVDVFLKRRTLATDILNLDKLHGYKQ